jgi:hypothetical protein
MEGAIQTGDCDVGGIARPAATTTPDAADAILTGRVEALAEHRRRYGMRPLLSRVTDLKALDGALDLSWHADQLHRLGTGLAPDLNRGNIVTTVAMMRRNGRVSFRGKHGGTQASRKVA